MGQEIFSNRRRAGTDDAHLCECLSGNERLEEPEDPSEDSGDVDEKFLVLTKRIKDLVSTWSVVLKEKRKMDIPRILDSSSGRLRSPLTLPSSSLRHGW